MVSFYPGPSQLYSQVKPFLAEIYDSGILSQNHRSPAFVEMSEQTIKSLKNKLDIPNNYTVFYTSSATECWEIISQSFLSLFSVHVFNGAFGEKWYNYRKKIMPNAAAIRYSPQKMPSLNQLKKTAETPEVICLTHNETSTATKLGNQFIKKVRKNFPNALVCVDATSSMAGVNLDWLSGDVWYASVQKCFGMPAGMAVMVCSPKALELATSIQHNNHYNSLVFLADKMENWQTTYTPNILNIALLGKVMETVPPIEQIHRTTKARKQQWENFLKKQGYGSLIVNSQVKSDTVFCIKETPEKVLQIRKTAENTGFILGKGYGKWKENTFRIANFPAIEPQAIIELQELLAEIKS